MEIQIDHFFKRAEIEIEERLLGRDGRPGHISTRAIEQHVDAVPFRQDGIPGGLQGGAFEDVGGQSDGVGTRIDQPQPCQHSLKFFGGHSEIEVRDLRPLGDEIFRSGRGESAQRPGDRDDLAANIEQ